MTLRKGLFITAYNRPDYFAQTMNSWRNVRGISDWKIFIRVEPSAFTQELRDIVAEADLSDNFRIVENPSVYGVLHHPWVGFEEMFNTFFDFVVRAEDDLIVSTDILEYFSWAAEAYRKDKEIGAVLAFTSEDGPQDEVTREAVFNPWVWGTWHDRWEKVIRDTWDHEYSTYNQTPGNEAGWDWNLRTRIFPQVGLKTISPKSSRVQNVGEWGVHGTPENLIQSPSFRLDRAPLDFYER